MSRCDDALPGRAKEELKALGERLSFARRRRRITQELMAERCFSSRSTLAKVEAGDPGVSMGTYATVLFMLGMEDQLSNLADVAADQIGSILGLDHVPIRVRGANADKTFPGSVTNKDDLKTPLDWCIAACSAVTSRESEDYLITPQHVLSVWQRQNDKCALSGLLLVPNAVGLFAPSLDRVDSDHGYEAGNIQIVLLAMNLMKNAHSDEAARELISAMRWNK